MEHETSFIEQAAVGDNAVITLRCAGMLHFDSAPLNRLFQEKGAATAEDIICRILEDIARQLDSLQDDLEHCAFQTMLKPARRIGLVADQIGLTEVSIAAYHVANCLTQKDGIALAATLARLERGFDIAVVEIWNFRDSG
ncbi:MAG: hypothetical protein IBX59_01940 [Yoonia sp.]|nr:hypothetical protein [Yoonia sp.]